MSGQAEFFAAGIIGFAPSVAIMFWGMRKYDYPYTEEALFSGRKLFGSFAVGMVAGTLLGALFSLLIPGSYEPFSNLIVLMLLAGAEEAGKMTYLNLPVFRGRFDAIFYGASLGLGIAAATAMVWAYTAITANPELAWNPISLAALGSISLSLTTLEFSTGSVLGLGASRGRTLGPYLTALAVRAAYAVPFALFLTLHDPSQITGGLALLIAVGGALGWWAHVRVIPEGIPEDIRRKGRRYRRRYAPD